MAKYTSKLNLYKADPSTDGDSTFNIDTMMNDNWDKIDDKVSSMDEKLSNVEDNANNYTHPATHSADMIHINDMGNKFTSDNAEDALQEIGTQVEEMINISATEPASYTNNTLWMQDVGDSDFSSGGGINIANAQTSAQPPIDNSYWFEPI